MKQCQKFNYLRKSTVILSVITLLTCWLISTGSLQNSDTLKRFQVTKSLWQDVPQAEVDDIEFRVIGKDGKPYAIWGVGQSLVMLPADIIAHTALNSLGITDPFAEKARTGLIAYSVFPIISILSIVISYQFLKLLGFSEGKAFLGSLGLLFGTTFLIYAQLHQENSLNFLLILSGYFFTTNWIYKKSKNLNLILASAALGFTILIRLTTVVDIFWVAIFTCASLYIQFRSGVIDIRALKYRITTYLKISIPIYFIFIGLERLYHWSRFETFFGTYLQLWSEQKQALDPTLPSNFPFTNPLPNGLLSYLFSPNNSIFLFDPLVVITLFLLIRCWRKISITVRLLAIIFIFSLISQMFIYGRWFVWTGGSWGARYLSVPVQLLGLLAIPMLLELWPVLRSGFEKLALKLIIIASFIFQLVSIPFDYNLELTQERLHGHDIFIIGQRFANIFTLISGRSEQLVSEIAILEDQPHEYTRIILMPWEQDIPLSIAPALKLIWFLGLITLFLLLFFSINDLKLGPKNKLE